MSDPGTRWITEAEVVDALDLAEAIEAVERGLPAQATGAATTMEKTHVAWGEGHTLHAIGAAWPGRHVVGVKAWAHTGGAAPLLILWDAEEGRCLAVIEAFALGQLRTAAMSAVATRWLARTDASVLALIGTGRQATAQLAAVAAVRPLTQVRVFSPTAENLRRFVAGIAGRFDLDVVAAASVADAVAGADVVTTATRARAPFLFGADLAPGTHVNAVGAITPERAELDRSVVERCRPVVTDSRAAAHRLASELGDRADLVELAELVQGNDGTVDDLSLFKPMGLGLADVILGVAVLEAVPAGRSVPAPVRHPPRLGDHRPATSEEPPR